MREATPREETPQGDDTSSTLRRRSEDYRHRELSEVSDSELWMELHHHSGSSSPDSSDQESKEKGKGKSKGSKAKATPKAKPKAKTIFPRDQAASAGNRPTQTVGSTAAAGSSAAPGQEPEPEEDQLRDPFFYMTREQQEEFTRAEERFWGLDQVHSESEHSHSGHS